MSRSPYKLHNSSDYLWLGLIVALGAVVRIAFLIKSGFVIDADEAIVGLMAKHIREGEPWPVFYYGQPYMGSLEAILTAVVFSLFGQSNTTLLVIPTAFSLVFIALVYFLSRRFTNRVGARIAAFFAALGPSALVVWSTKARGGFIELVTIGTAALIVAADLLKAEKPKTGNFILLGALLGLGWWVNNQIVFYAVPIAFVFIFHFLRTFGFKRSMSFAGPTIAAFFAGGFPFWYANIFQTPRFNSFAVLMQSAGSFHDVVKHLRGFFRESLPILFGARQFWSTEDIFAGATPLAMILFFTVFGVVFYQWLYAPDGLLRLPRKFSPTRRPVGFLLLFFVLMPVIFASSHYGWLSQAPRYLLPLYSVYFVLIGLSVSSLWRSSAWGTNALSMAIVSLVLVVHLASNYAHGGAIPGEPFVFEGERVAKDQRELYAWLRAENYTHIRTNYWIGYRVAFETNEEITFSMSHGPKQVRIPAYEQKAPNDYESAVFVFVPKEAALFTRGIAELGFRFREARVGGYDVVDRIVPVISRGPRLHITPEQVTVTAGAKSAKYMIDDNIGTRWGTGTAQQPGMKVEILLGKAVNLSGLTLDLGSWSTDYPRALLVEVQEPNGTWCTVFDDQNNEPLNYVLEDERIWEIFFPPQQVMTIRLTQLGYDAVFDWSIAELGLFEAGNGDES